MLLNNSLSSEAWKSDAKRQAPEVDSEGKHSNLCKSRRKHKMEEKDLPEYFWKCSKAYKTQRIILLASKLHLQAKVVGEVCFPSRDKTLQST